MINRIIVEFDSFFHGGGTALWGFVLGYTKVQQNKFGDIYFQITTKSRHCVQFKYLFDAFTSWSI